MRDLRPAAGVSYVQRDTSIHRLVFTDPRVERVDSFVIPDMMPSSRWKRGGGRLFDGFTDGDVDDVKHCVYTPALYPNPHTEPGTAVAESDTLARRRREEEGGELVSADGGGGRYRRHDGCFLCGWAVIVGV